MDILKRYDENDSGQKEPSLTIDDIDFAISLNLLDKNSADKYEIELIWASVQSGNMSPLDASNALSLLGIDVDIALESRESVL